MLSSPRPSWGALRDMALPVCLVQTECVKRVLGMALSGLLGASGIDAQAPTHVVRGRIFEVADTTRPVVGAQVELLGKAVRTNNEGVFRLREVPPGDHELRVLRLGFKGVTRSVTVAADSAIVDVALERNTPELTEIVIEGRRVWVPPRLGEVYERAARGWGTLFTADDIKERNPVDLKSLLNTVPGVYTGDRHVTFIRCNRVQVYVDGVRRTNYSFSSRGDGDERRDVNNIVKEVFPSNVAAMEVYTSVARLPAEFHSDACAAIAVWTKSY